ncbi:MAG: glycosyltransferase family 2 protein [Ruminococcus sp.]|nr:glycosyltransferase family 2 protein [Ruminococcus sp.]
MKAAPEISLIMSVYNGEDYLSDAIESVLNQTFADFELIVINDCSTDKTCEILKRYEELDNREKALGTYVEPQPKPVKKPKKEKKAKTETAKNKEKK